MLIKMGSSFGGVDVLDAPKIEFDGSWFSWYVEFYGGTPYWEAQLFSSGTLTVQGSYVADLCGIGGVSMREQYAALENTEAFLQEKVARLRESAEKKRRSYRSLGALAGAMIAVILF